MFINSKNFFHYNLHFFPYNDAEIEDCINPSSQIYILFFEELYLITFGIILIKFLYTSIGCKYSFSLIDDFNFRYNLFSVK